MSEQKQKMLQLELITNGGERITIEYEKWDSRDCAVAEFVADWMEKLNHPAQFSSSELMEADWMPTQSAILHETGYCSLLELAKRAERTYLHRQKRT